MTTLISYLKPRKLRSISVNGYSTMEKGRNLLSISVNGYDITQSTYLFVEIWQ